MQQYFAKNKNLELEDSDYHHIRNVMRMKKGDVIKIVYDGFCYDCKLNMIVPNISFDIISKQKLDNNYSVDVAFSLIKEQKLDYLLQKSTEVGVGKLIPIHTKRSIIKIDRKKEQSKIERWNKIVKEASEQSFRGSMPIVTNILSLKEL